MSGSIFNSLLSPVIFLGLASTAVQAADNADIGQNEDVPSLEFLEFLGQWETDAGEWLGPEQFVDGDFVQLLEVALPAETDTGLSTDSDDTDATDN